ncbi:hypothetical protein Tmel_0309 [Thermosipho melanesiensis BI429]|uniref:Uncharacterized protein n=1 Tax=Thermosipho melanesiensis (strain DSM 12029 / CIP 104789 / BI429) TaxID=391009 RepID=A6LJT0_THEM4|nr:hypothetical protein Tmel_0309 [Thermosipho melanesiensis BI429]
MKYVKLKKIVIAKRSTRNFIIVSIHTHCVIKIPKLAEGI